MTGCFLSFGSWFFSSSIERSAFSGCDGWWVVDCSSASLTACIESSCPVGDLMNFLFLICSFLAKSFIGRWEVILTVGLYGGT